MIEISILLLLPGWEGSLDDGHVLRVVVVRHNGLNTPKDMSCIYAYKTQKEWCIFFRR